MSQPQALDFRTLLFPVDPRGTHVFKGKKYNLVKFNFVKKGGSTGKRGLIKKAPGTARGLEIMPGILEYCLNNFCRNYNGI